MRSVYKLFSLLLILGLAATPACAQTEEMSGDEGAEESGSMSMSENEKTFYALGLAMSQSLGQFDLSEDELESVKEGLTDGVLGNEADLQSADFLSYFACDPETKVIGGYLEGVRDGPYFLRSLKAAAARKPVVLWRVGLTAEGSRAASSHTGALAGSERIWHGLMNQCGAVAVFGWEAWVDTMMAFYLLPPAPGGRVAVISGPGGLAVSAAEAAGRHGLQMAELSGQTRQRLAEHIPPTGTSLANPVDVSLTAHMDMNIFIQAADLVAADPGVDAVAVIGSGLDENTNNQYVEGMIRAQKKSGKPFLIVAIPGMPPDTGRSFCQAGVPFFDTAEKAMAAYSLVRAYYSGRAEFS